MNSDKPLLLFFPFGQLAHYLRCLTLAKKLAPYFEIRVAYSQRYASFIEAAGFKTFHCNGLDADAVLACVKTFDFSWLQKESLEGTLTQQIAAIEQWKPALVLGDTVPTLKMAAEAAGHTLDATGLVHGRAICVADEWLHEPVLCRRAHHVVALSVVPVLFVLAPCHFESAHEMG